MPSTIPPSVRTYIRRRKAATRRRFPMDKQRQEEAITALYDELEEKHGITRPS